MAAVNDYCMMISGIGIFYLVSSKSYLFSCTWQWWSGGSLKQSTSK